MKRLALLLITIALFTQGHAQPQIVFEQVATGVSGITDIEHAGDSRLFIVDKAGLIRVMYPDYSFQQDFFLDIRPKVNPIPSEMGLLGLAFHPDFNSNGIFFVNYTNYNDETVVSRFHVDLNDVNVADPTSEEVLIRVSQPFTNHNAGDISFGPDGYLYITMGDGGAGGDPGNRGQDSLNFLGKILRIDVDTTQSYKIPEDNPFVGNSDVADEIWSLGWRNPWRFSFDRETGEMWIADVGQGRFEEVNVEAPGTGGLNYGWRCYEGPNPYNTDSCIAPENYVDPVFSYDHLSLLGGSITGGFVYRGSQYPNLVGHYVFGDYKSGNVWTLKADSNGGYRSTFWGKRFNRNQLSTFGENLDGEIFAGEISTGLLYKLTDTSAVSSTNIGTEIDSKLRIHIEAGRRMLTVSLDEGEFVQPRIVLYSVSGQEFRPAFSFDSDKVEANVASLTRGMYVVRVEDQGKIYVKKVRMR